MLPMFFLTEKLYLSYFQKKSMMYNGINGNQRPEGGLK